MKNLILVILFIVACMGALGQEQIYRGRISYLTAQNIYVRFDVANNLQVGDTLFVDRDGDMKPLIAIESRSSLSCIGAPLSAMEVSLGEEVVGTSASTQKKEKSESALLEKAQKEVSTKVDTQPKTTQHGFTQKIKGRISASSYSSFSDETENTHRLRYNFSMQADNIANSRFSTDTYFTFTHRTGDWASVQENIFNALKIYSLALKYEMGEQSSVWVGRRINRNISNIGAIDGLQYETGYQNFRLGAVLGFRPDYYDYSMNTDLLEYGAYLAHELKTETGIMNNSVAFFQQMNKGNTDRRFAYFQHSNSLLKNLDFFVSSELDLYKLENGVSKNTLSLTSLYLSIRYRVIRQLSLYASYDARKNVIYFETFKNLAEQLLEEATRQGLQFRINYRPTNLLSIGGNASYRVRDNDIRATKTLNGVVSFSRIPELNASATITASFLQTSYLDGITGGVRFYKDLFNGKLYSSLGYRYVDYQFINAGSNLKQHTGELELSWRLSKKITISANYEGTVQKSALYNQVYLNLTKRF
ncbi:hypothetical protein [Sunxiuqinia sp. sy24]|uniref:hypothetical protein n=1 Tax=Sunxiuqinia sp. sy24 TaxID=3461495 RepID=UPI00404634CD